MNTFTDFITFPEVEFSDEEFDSDNEEEYVYEQSVSEYPSEITEIYDSIMKTPCHDTDAAIDLMDYALSCVKDAMLAYDLMLDHLMLDHKNHFRNLITPELIAEAMHPRRMMIRLNQCDDFERFFECS